MFPPYSYHNLHLKLQEIQKNIFLNDFLYDVLDTIPLVKNKMIMRDHFRMNYLEYEDNYDTNLEQVYQREMLDLNKLFLLNGEKDTFYDRLKYIHQFKRLKHDEFDNVKKEAIC